MENSRQEYVKREEPPWAESGLHGILTE